MKRFREDYKAITYYVVMIRSHIMQLYSEVMCSYYILQLYSAAVLCFYIQIYFAVTLRSYILQPYSAVIQSVVMCYCLFCSNILQLHSSVILCSHILHLYSVVMSKLSTHMVNDPLAHMAVHFKSKFQYTGPDLQQHDDTAVQVIAQQYSSTTFASLSSSARKENFGDLKKRCFISSAFLKYTRPEMSYFKLLKAQSDVIIVSLF